MRLPFSIVIAVLSTELDAIRPPLLKLSVCPPKFKLVTPATTIAKLLISRLPVRTVVPIAVDRMFSVIAPVSIVLGE